MFHLDILWSFFIKRRYLLSTKQSSAATRKLEVMVKMIWVEKQLHKGKVIYFVTTKHESDKLKLFTYDPWITKQLIFIIDVSWVASMCLKHFAFQICCVRRFSVQVKFSQYEFFYQSEQSDTTFSAEKFNKKDDFVHSFKQSLKM